MILLLLLNYLPISRCKILKASSKQKSSKTREFPSFILKIRAQIIFHSSKLRDFPPRLFLPCAKKGCSALLRPPASLNNIYSLSLFLFSDLMPRASRFSEFPICDFGEINEDNSRFSFRVFQNRSIFSFNSKKVIQFKVLIASDRFSFSRVVG